MITEINVSTAASTGEKSNTASFPALPQKRPSTPALILREATNWTVGEDEDVIRLKKYFYLDSTLQALQFHQEGMEVSSDTNLVATRITLFQPIPRVGVDLKLRSRIKSAHLAFELCQRYTHLHQQLITAKK